MNLRLFNSPKDMDELSPSYKIGYYDVEKALDRRYRTEQFILKWKFKLGKWLVAWQRRLQTLPKMLFRPRRFTNSLAGRPCRTRMHI